MNTLPVDFLRSGDPINIVGRKPFETWTADIPSSWYCIDLGLFIFCKLRVIFLGPGRTLLLTYITLRHGSNSRQDCLRNWVVQCSDDGKCEKLN